MIKYLKDSYDKYLETADEPVDKRTYLDLVAAYNKFLIEKCLDGHEVTLPSRLGILSIVGRQSKVRFENGKPVGLAPDWVKTKKLWDSNPEAKKKKQLLYHTNAHSQGFRYKWNWSKTNVLVENKTLYSLILSRANKRAVHKLILEGKQFITK